VGLALMAGVDAREVCRGFRNTGRCRFGSVCKYEHSEGAAIEPPPVGECIHYRDEGKCSREDRCRYTHGANDPRFDESGRRRIDPNEICRNYQRGRCARGEDCQRQHPQKEGGIEDEVCNNYLQGHCRWGENCKRRHEGDPRPVVPIDEVCRNFQRGKCQRGELCARQHVAAPPAANSDAADETAPRPRRRRTARKRRPRKPGGQGGGGKGGAQNGAQAGGLAEAQAAPAQPKAPRRLDEECNNYAAGKCRKGENCRRQHVGNVEQLPVQKLQEDCNKFKEGRCRFGDLCRRQHPA